MTHKTFKTALIAFAAIVLLSSLGIAIVNEVRDKQLQK